jgi:hypothetical protein
MVSTINISRLHMLLLADSGLLGFKRKSSDMWLNCALTPKAYPF